MAESIATTPAPTATETSAEPEEDVVDWGAEDQGAEGDAEPAPAAGAAEGEGDEPEIGAEGEGDAPDAAETDKPPEFWSADKKALWSKVTDPEVRAAIRDHEKAISVATARKLEESAVKVRQAEDGAKVALGNQDQLAAWWKQNGQSIQRMMLGRWADVDWNRLSTESPADYVRLKQEFEAEQGMVRQMGARHQQEVERSTQRELQKHQQARASEHAKLAEKYPKEFGSGAAEKTYEALSKYVLAQGIAPERLEGIYEVAVVEMIRKAYRYDQLQAKARKITDPRMQATPASQTPKRVVPGPGVQPGNRTDEATRQALERLRSGAKLSAEEGAAAFR